MATNLDFLKDLLARSQRPQGESDGPLMPGAAPLTPTRPVPVPMIRDLPFVGQFPTTPDQAAAPPVVPAANVPPPGPMNMGYGRTMDTETDATVPPIVPAGMPGMNTTSPETPTGLVERRRSLEDELARYNDPDRYMPGGEGRNNKWSILEKIGAALAGWASGGLAGGIKAATDRNYFNKMRDEQHVAEILPKIAQQQQIAQFNANQERSRIANENVLADNAYQNERLVELRADRKRKEEDRSSRERTARMNSVAGILKNLPAYDPNNPKFAELTKALGDVNLPVTPKDAKKTVRLVQDQRSGAWSTVLTDPVTGKQETRDVIKDGRPFISTPTVVMQGEYGLLKQNDQQGFTAEQNQADREFRSRLEAGKIQAQLAFRQLAAVQGQQKALESARKDFIDAYQKQNGVPPNDDQVQQYLAAVSGQ